MDTGTKTRHKWNDKYRRSQHRLPAPCSILEQGSYLLPARGTALDIACGVGGNALFLAKAGLDTVAVDISDVAIEKLQQHAVAEGLSIHTLVRSADSHYFAAAPGQFDVITVSNYLDRELFKILPDMLKPGGLLFYQTFVKDKADPQTGPSNPAFLLNENELLELTSGLSCRMFIDLGTTGRVTQGLRNQSCIIAQKEN